MASNPPPAIAGDTGALPAQPQGSAGASPYARLSEFMAQPAVKRTIPALGGLAAIAAAGLAYMAITAGPQRVLYSDLTDAERASVAEALTGGGIGYEIDPGTGMITVAQDDLYAARMLVASNTGLAAPQDASQMLDAIPLGSSRTLEGERLRLARERELMMTIQEIDGINSVRVHLATPERSVFVRENSPPSASVMVRLSRSRSLSKDQVDAIVNLVSGSVPGLASDAVRVVDQNGRLLTSDSNGVLDELMLQREFEAKLRDQIGQLLVPLLGEGNFTSEVQIDLDRQEVTSARETYDQEGVVRSEATTSANRAGGSQVGGVPGVLANTPPPPAELVEEAPEGGEAQPAETTPGDSETSARRDYEIGREVAVTSTRPGGVNRISVAVAVSASALEAIAPADEERIQALIEAAVGADAERGDVVTVVTGAFEAPAVEEPAFYEQPWFEMVVRYGAAVLAVLLVLLLGVRPMLKRLKEARQVEQERAEEAQQALLDAGGVELSEEETAEVQRLAAQARSEGVPADLAEQVALARRLAEARPDRAVAALQRMLAAPEKPEAV
ncbi:flagellar basal-body MS-ring/collar protein FliF [Altererythrobacter lutimaris]